MLKQVLLLLLGLSFGALIGLYIGSFYDLPFAKTPDDFSAWGGFFGGFLGTAVAFVALYFAYKANASQNEQFERQSFESGFFSLMNLFFQSLEQLTSDNEFYQMLSGRRLLDKIISDRLDSIHSYSKSYDIEVNYKQSFMRLNELLSQSSQLNVFIRGVIGVFKFISISRINDQYKSSYANTFVRLLNDSEQGFLLFCSITNKEIRTWVDDYGLSLGSESIGYEVDLFQSAYEKFSLEIGTDSSNQDESI